MQINGVLKVTVGFTKYVLIRSFGGKFLFSTQKSFGDEPQYKISGYGILGKHTWSLANHKFKFRQRGYMNGK